MREVAVATIQLEVTRDKELNIKRAMEFVDVAARRGANAVLLPEGWYSGLPERTRSKEEMATFFCNPDDDVVKTLCAKAKEHGIYLIGGCLYIKENGKVYERTPLIGPDGVIIDWIGKGNNEDMDPKAELTHGICRTENPAYKVYDTEIGKIGVIVDIDMCAVEVARILGLQGVEIIFWPLGWTLESIKTIDHFAFAGSLVSDAYVVSSCQVGWGHYFDYDIFHGGSSIYHLRDCVAKVPNDYEGVAVAYVEFQNIESRRNTFRDHYPNWRRPETYGLITDVEAEKKIRGYRG